MPQSDLLRYFLGLGAVFLGAWGVELTGSLIPLALGGSVALMTTASLVRRLLARTRR